LITEKTNIRLLLYFLLFLIILWALPAWAVQSHGAAEGLVSHEVGHLLFMAGFVYLLFMIYKNWHQGKGWKEFIAFLVLILCWNLLTFSGHWMREFVEPSKFVKEKGNISGFHITNFSDAYFYLSRLDHLILVPAFILLLAALKKWRYHK